MAKITRKFLKMFGQTGATANFGQFGSAKAGAAATSKDVEALQALAAWLGGWQDATITNAYGFAPFQEDMNAVCYVLGYHLAYLQQEGVSEWNNDTTYYIGSIVKKTGTFELYGSLTDTNTSNALPSQTSDTK